jgi:cytochrome P450
MALFDTVIKDGAGADGTGRPRGDVGIKADVDLDTLDLSDLGHFAYGPPHELFARMRAEVPVHLNRCPDGATFWNITRAEDIIEISRDAETWSSERGGVWFRPDTLFKLEVGRSLLLFKDPPGHTTYRNILRTAFLPRIVTSLDEQIEEIVTARLDALVALGEGDLVTDLAVPVPLNVITRILGVPDEDMHLLLRWTEQLERGLTLGHDADPILAEMGGYFAQLVADERVRGEDSLTNALFAAEVDGVRLNELEIAIFFSILVFAGNDTTRNAFSGGMQALIEHPDQLERLRREPELMQDAVEEILRWTTPLNYFARTATRDTVVRGVPISEGERVVMWYAAANRDPNFFPDADRFDITRHRVAHSTFGGGGPHYCLGAHLARRELTILLGQTLARLRDLEITGPTEKVVSTWVNSLTTLPVRFTAG